MAIRAAVVVVLLALAGCQTLGGTERGTVTPAPVPEPTGAGTGVPGVGNDSVVSADRLATTHADAVTNRSYTLWMRLSSGTSTQVVHLAVEDAYRYEYRTESVGRSYSDATFVDGERRYSRHERPLGVTYRVGEPIPLGRLFGHSPARFVRNYLSVDDTRVRVVERDGTREYEIVATNVSRPALDGSEEYDVRAVVTPPGFVRSFHVAYQSTAGNASVEYEFRYTNVDATTVDRPAWVRDRRGNATDSHRQTYDSR